VHRRRGPSEILLAPSQARAGKLAPPAQGGGAALKLPGKNDFPRLDDHVVEPETREEMVRGERVHAQPAKAPHGDRHFRLDYVLGAHVREGYVGSTDLLTHVLHGSDFASDTCIRREGEDPATGALEARNNPAIVAMKATSEERGERRALAAAVLAVLESRGIEVPPEVRSAVLGAKEPSQLHRWLGRAATVTRAEDVIREEGDPPRAAELR
jgi:hypothetical protein